MAADGTGVARITHNDANQSGPSWSPDGTRIAYNSDAAGNYDIYSMNVDGSSIVQHTVDPADDTLPSWSPDGQQIAFVSGGRICIVGVDGGGVLPVTDTAGSFPAWSPIGSRMAFMRVVLDYSYIYTVNTDGTDLVKLIWGGVGPCIR